MSVKYQVKGFLKLSERDDPENGCIPETSQAYEVDITIKGDSPSEVLKNIMEYFGCEKDDIILNACEDAGRIDIQVMETADGYRATNADILAWKHGNRALYACTYTGNLEKVIPLTWGNYKGYSNDL